MKISVCGKGGSGKSTVLTLLAVAAKKRGIPVLVVDSDESNTGLFRMLGFEKPPVPLMDLLGGKTRLKEKMQAPNIFEQPEITIEHIPTSYVQRRDGLSLISIGKILQSLEGCACPMGVLSREFLKKLRLEKETIAFVDMEAGVEHFGRGIDEGIDKVILVIEPSFESITVAEKIRELAVGMQKDINAIINKAPSETMAQKLQKVLQNKGIEIIGSLPNDPMIFEACLEGLMPDRGDAFQAADEMLPRLLS